MVGIYPRQSIEKKDSLSIDAQIKACADYCTAHGWEYKVYDQDHGYSGKNLDRPGFQAMISDVHTGLIDKIICYKLDRISRNISDFSQLLVELEKYKCEFISVSENFDTTSPIGRAMVYICMVFAQMERENIQERVISNYYYRTGLGFWGGGLAPYGYRLKRVQIAGKMHTVLEPDPDTSKIVKNLYEWYLEPGGSANTVLDRLNCKLHIPSRNGQQAWTSRVLMDILSRPLYTQNTMDVYNFLTQGGVKISNPPGDFDGKMSVNLYGKKDKNASNHKRCREACDMYCNVSLHEAIIDSDTWLKVQYKRLSRLRIPGRTGSGKNSWFTGLMICGCCGKHVSYTHSTGSLGYYICSTRKNKGWNSCTGPTLSKKIYDPIIVAAVRDHYSSPDVLQRIQDAKIKQEVPINNAKKNALQIELSSIDTQIGNLISSLASGNSTVTKYINDAITELDSRRNTINHELLQIDMEVSVNDESEKLKQIEWAIGKLDEAYNGDDFDLAKQVSSTLIRQITFNADKSISFQFAI